MKTVFLVSADKKNKAEIVLKADDLVSRGSIVVRSASSLDIAEDGYFIIVEASENATKKAKELVKDLAAVYDKATLVIEKMREQEEAAIEGFGNIIG